MRHNLRRWILLSISTLPVMTGAVLAPGLPDLRAAFGNGTRAHAWAQWALTTPALFTALGANLAGILADRTGRRLMLLTSLALFGMSGGIGGLLNSLPAIAASRAVLGLAAGGVGTVATTLIVDYHDDGQSAFLAAKPQSWPLGRWPIPCSAAHSPISRGERRSASMFSL